MSLNESVVVMLKDKNRETPEMLYANKKRIPFKIVKY